MKHIVSFSGGKDSTAMLLMLIEKDFPIDEIIFCDTGLEFPAMYDHIKAVEKYIGRDITIIKPDKDFYHYFSFYKRKNKTCKHADRIGLGFPGHLFRWCTTYLKIQPINRYCKSLGNNIQYVGYSYDEIHRSKRKSIMKKKNLLFPLIDWKISSSDALKYCYSKGFHWGGLYDIFSRVSCWCCPLQSLKELKALYINFPDYWEQLKGLEKLSLHLVNRSFRTDYSIHELEARFKKEIFIEDQQYKIEI